MAQRYAPTVSWPERIVAPSAKVFHREEREENKIREDFRLSCFMQDKAIKKGFFPGTARSLTLTRPGYICAAQCRCAANFLEQVKEFVQFAKPVLSLSKDPWLRFWTFRL